MVPMSVRVHFSITKGIALQNSHHNNKGPEIMSFDCLIESLSNVSVEQNVTLSL